MHPKSMCKNGRRKGAKKAAPPESFGGPFWDNSPSKIGSKIDAKIDAQKVRILMPKWSKIGVQIDPKIRFVQLMCIKVDFWKSCFYCRRVAQIEVLQA